MPMGYSLEKRRPGIGKVGSRYISRMLKSLVLLHHIGIQRRLSGTATFLFLRETQLPYGKQQGCDLRTGDENPHLSPR